MKLKYKIIALNVATLFVMLIIAGTIVLEITDDFNLQAEFKYLQNQGEYASTLIEQYIESRTVNVFDIPKFMEKNSPYLASLLKRTVKCSVQIFYDNRLIGDSDDISVLNSNMTEIIKVASNKTSAYYISKGKNRVFYYATPVAVDNKYTYTVGFTYELTNADRIKTRIKQMLFIIILLSTLILTLVSPIISNRLTYPIKALSAATKQFAKGVFDVRTPEVTTADEVGELSKTFNSMADSIQDMITKLEYEKDKQKHFFDNFTHEIRTPLTTIIGFSELLWKTNDEEVRDKSLFHITSEGKRMLKMVERLLELSKLKNFGFELHKVETNLKTLIEDVCDSMNYKAKRYNIRFNLDLKNVYHMVDPDLFKQVIINIVDNSIKYSKSAKIDITLKKDNNIFLTIADYGCGMDPLYLENIFEPYYKIDKSRNSSVEGWGLGLSIVKEIITKHNGSINIYSYPSRGTKFEIKL